MQRQGIPVAQTNIPTPTWLNLIDWLRSSFAALPSLRLATQTLAHKPRKTPGPAALQTIPQPSNLNMSGALHQLLVFFLVLPLASATSLPLFQCPLFGGGALGASVPGALRSGHPNHPAVGTARQTAAAVLPLAFAASAWTLGHGHAILLFILSLLFFRPVSVLMPLEVSLSPSFEIWIILRRCAGHAFPCLRRRRK